MVKKKQLFFEEEIFLHKFSFRGVLLGGRCLEKFVKSFLMELQIASKECEVTQSATIITYLHDYKHET